MKKTFITLICILISTLAVRAEDFHRIITFEELPVKAQEFVNSYFPGQDIRFIRMEFEVKKTEYTVRFENGMEIEFNGDGDWEEIESHKECLPYDFLQEEIKEFLLQKHPDFCLHEISKGRHKIEIELDYGIEIIFKDNGEFLRYDD